jgi:hypothetical protein
MKSEEAKAEAAAKWAEVAPPEERPQAWEEAARAAERAAQARKEYLQENDPLLAWVRDRRAPEVLVQASIQEFRAADPKNVQQVAASQLEILTGYHLLALAQSRQSFFWALISSGIGLIFFVAAVTLVLLEGVRAGAVVPLFSGTAFEAVSAFVFHLYGKTSSQLSILHRRLDVLQHYLIANSMCEGLSEAERDKARAALIAEMSRAPRADAQAKSSNGRLSRPSRKSAASRRRRRARRPGA